ncbi:MlaD family protein [Desulfovibrio sp. OttesenSCG-928-I05]|nr:MlaD family protein [Desulfovibrio sp. OttesenSCG-928-I05]
METKASYILVGAFTLLVVAGALIFILWIGGDSKGQSTPYVVKVNQSVSGLSVGNDVVFNGVRVGQVSRITLSPLDPASVTVLIQVAPDTPVRMDSVASLEIRGITGISVVSITGGTAASPLVKSSGDAIAEIPYKASGIQEIMASVPEIMSNLNELVERGNAILSPENAKSFNVFMTALADTMEGVAEGRESIAETLASFNEAAKNVSKLAASVNDLSDSTRKIVDTQFKNAMDALAKAASGAQRIVAVAEPAMQRFSREALEDVHTLITEARNLLNRLALLASSIESDPRRFFFGNSVPEYSVP